MRRGEGEESAHAQAPTPSSAERRRPRAGRVRVSETHSQKERAPTTARTRDDRGRGTGRRRPSVAAPGAAADERGGEEQRRPDKVELLLDAEGPVVLQRRHRPVGVEVVRRLEGESVIADVEGARHSVLGDRFRLEGSEHGDRDHDGHDDHQDRRRQQAAGPPRVEVGEGEPSAGGELVPEQLGDQVPGDDEEDVDADVAPGHREAGVVGDDGQDGDRPEPLDIPTPGARSHLLLHSRPRPAHRVFAPEAVDPPKGRHANSSSLTTRSVGSDTPCREKGC